MAPRSIHPLVRDLYKRFIRLGHDYPLGVDFIRRKVKAAFHQNAHLKTEIEIKRAVARGRYMVRELVGVIKLKKYRTLKKRYAGG